MPVASGDLGDIGECATNGCDTGNRIAPHHYVTVAFECHTMVESHRHLDHIGEGRDGELTLHVGSPTNHTPGSCDSQGMVCPHGDLGHP